MNVLDMVRTRFANVFSGWKVGTELDAVIAMYDMLYLYYASNGLYSDLQKVKFYLGEWTEAMKPLYNPANRSVEFFVSHVMPEAFPGDLEIVTENALLRTPLEAIAKWSQFNAKKPVAIRWLAIYGDLFIHPASNTDDTKTYLQFLKPQNVTSWKEDVRGNVIDIRIDVEITGGKMHTEIWNTEKYWIWEHHFGRNTPMAHLNGLVESGDLATDFDIDFCPFVHVKFRDVGENRGWGAFTHCLDKVDEGNRMATRLHQMLFRYNKAFWAISANNVDPSGRPLPAPHLGSPREIVDDTIFELPGNSTMNSMVPNLQYAQALEVLHSQLAEIEKDLPELRYGNISGDLSGRAVRLLLAGAIDRTKEARTNWEQGLIRAFQMALSLRFSAIGSFDAGELDFTFPERDVLPISVNERAETMKLLTDAGIDAATAGRLAGFKLEELVPQV